ncbi:hypothetical protein EDB81DRAFT_831576 [Dactylonectria macrodidyma]|uniref:Secreted protein n=1 Tax=Dactylonectria macrodidyma TaxID=307937 RepID=A0A9P9D1K3_9HYPO|nr:hypothetical protein EDB81DRAFT_831576 [Dactylonectria macrodidyma]
MLLLLHPVALSPLLCLLPPTLALEIMPNLGAWLLSEKYKRGWRWFKHHIPLSLRIHGEGSVQFLLTHAPSKPHNWLHDIYNPMVAMNLCCSGRFQPQATQSDAHSAGTPRPFFPSGNGSGALSSDSVLLYITAA